MQRDAPGLRPIYWESTDFCLVSKGSGTPAHESTAAEPFLHLLRINNLVTLRHSSL
jgi:hypothetical protein